MIPIGVSISDLALAVKVIYKVCSAFRDASGANQQYTSTAAFLDAFARTLERLIEYTESTLQPSESTDTKLSDDLTAQMRLLWTEYIKFDDYLKKVEPGLSSKSITSRVAARAKWAIKELAEKVEGLKRAVIAPMMLVTPLLAVEVLRELKDLKAQLPEKDSYEAAVRQNSKVILQVNSDLAHLRSNLDSWWWNRRWAMTAVEEDVKTLKFVVKQNTDLIESSRQAVQESVSRETQKQAASNIETITVLETVMSDRLGLIEGQLDQLIYDTRGKTGKDDKELGHIKTRIANSRSHLRQAAKSARQCLKSFGLLVIAVNDMHSDLVPAGMLPFAKLVVGYNKIYEAGQKFVKYGGQTIESGGKGVEQNDVLSGLKSWNPFAAGGSGEGARQNGREDDGGVGSSSQNRKPASGAGSSSSASQKRPQPDEKRTLPVQQDEGYDSSHEKPLKPTPPTLSRTSTNSSTSTLVDTAPPHQRKGSPEMEEVGTSNSDQWHQPHKEHADLMSFEESDPLHTVHAPLRAEQSPARVRSSHDDGLEENPWAS